jgi:hypothetical protein
MTITFKGYHDAALTEEIDSGNTHHTTHVVGATDPTDKIVYFGSTVSGKKLQAASNPGTDPVVVSVVDANAGTGAPASEFKLALSSGGLAGATPGAPLILSATLLSGVANAVPIYTRRVSALNVSANYLDISLDTNAITESPV